jgi:hypothetical protein
VSSSNYLRRFSLTTRLEKYAIDGSPVVSRKLSPHCRSRMIRRQSERLKMRRGAGSVGAIPMLPAPFQFIIAMIAYAINERLARRVDYPRAEVLVLKEVLAVATGKSRLDLSAEQRRRLALKGKELTA